MPDIELLAKLAAGVLDNKNTLAQLLAAKKHSDAGQYELKNRILKDLMQQAPDEWVVDDPKPKYKGVNHLPTKFKLHADPRIIDTRVSIADLAKRAADKTFNVFEGAKKPVDYVAPEDKALRVPILNKQQAQNIVDAMASATKYDALKDVRIGLGANKLENFEIGRAHV